MFVKLTVYDACLEGEFAKYYEQYFGELKEKMLNDGFEWDEATKTFSHHEEMEQTVATQETEVVPVEAN